MYYKQIKIFYILLFSTTIVTATTFNFKLNYDGDFIYNGQHLIYPKTNAAIFHNKHEMDILRLRVAADSKNELQVILKNPKWKSIPNFNKNLPIINQIIINEPFIYKGVSTIFCDIVPWKLTNNNLEVLLEAEIIISVENKVIPFKSFHPELINGVADYSININSDGVQYLILCSNHLIDAAEIISNMHQNEVPVANQLKTDIIVVDEILDSNPNQNPEDSIRDYLLNRISNDSNYDLKYLMIIGDENAIPPIFYEGVPSDDFYTSTSLSNGDAQLYSGRIPATTLSQATSIINKIRDYTLNLPHGIWKSKIALVADDLNRSCNITYGEASHTNNSQDIYNLLSPLLPISPFYGVNYNLSPQPGGCYYPELTNELINSINRGLGLINYIGHGDPETWAGEQILTKSRDLSLIYPDDQKLAIWLAGTCSFGKYYNQDTFMESLLYSDGGAIAVISTTDVIGYTDNKNYLENFMDHVYKYVDDQNNYRLGEIVFLSKFGDRLFHIFGDPALKLPFPKKDLNLTIENPTELAIIEEQYINLNNSNLTTLIAMESANNIVQSFNVVNNNTIEVEYTIPGSIFSQSTFNGNSACFRVPIDVDMCNNCFADLIIYQEDNFDHGKIQMIKNIPFINNIIYFNDNIGPQVSIYQEDRQIVNYSPIYEDLSLEIILEDESGINLMGGIGHNLKYWFDENEPTLISGEDFIYNDNCISGKINLFYNDQLSIGSHIFNLEAWDGLNNLTTFSINVDVIKNQYNNDNFSLDYVYPFPNPFSEYTFFTMVLSEHPADITLSIYNIEGKKIKTLKHFTETSFVKIRWDGLDENGNKIANNTYLYHIQATTMNNDQFENIYKITKIE